MPREKTSSAAPAHSPIEEMSENEESPFEAGSFDGEAVKFNEELEAIDKAVSVEVIHSKKKQKNSKFSSSKPLRSSAQSFL